jgi:hypothetical protein
MNDQPSSDDRLVRYLLGDALPDAEQNEIEESYFTNDLYFDRVLAVEDDLIDRQIRGSMSAGEKARFEKHFLASERRREKWEAQRAIASFFRSRNETPGLIRFLRSLTSGTRLLLAVSVLVLVVGVSVLGRGYVDLRREYGGLHSRLVALEKQSAGLPAIVTLDLRTERLRSGAGDRFQIAADARWVELRVELPQSASALSSFAAGLSTADGEEVWRQNGLARIGSTLQIDLPASVLKRGDYVLSVSAVGGERPRLLPSYQFRIDHGPVGK